jgi:ribosomal protein S18 acetylase RimI-like enzyme
MTTIRRMRVDEASLLRHLTAGGVAREAAAHPEDRIGISEQGLDNLETHYRLGAVHPDQFTLVAEEEGGEIVGFVDAEIVHGRSLPGVAGEIGDLYLAESAGPEVAEALARAAVERLRERGARVITHTEDATRPERDPWESLGFEADVLRFSLYD